jgi:hypothetical protein
METKDITKGKCHIVHGNNENGNGVFSIDIDGWNICSVWYVSSNDKEFETRENANLICEAFNVANETGLSPKQMNERIKEFEGLLKIAFQLLDTREIPTQTELNILKIDLITALNNKQ